MSSEAAPFSRLYGLEPIGAGTGSVESLTGYVARLAGAHGVTAGRLVVDEVIPLLSGMRWAKRDARRRAAVGVFVRGLPTVDGPRAAAGGWLAALEQLTNRGDLGALTLRSWERLPDRGLLRAGAAFCPACFQDDLAAGREPHERLLWRVALVEFCPVHDRPLDTSCPRCGARRRALVWRSRPGYCPECWKWLGCAERTVLLRDELTRCRLLVARLVADALAARSVSPTAEGIGRSLATIAAGTGTGGRCDLARRMGVSKSNMRTWLDAGRAPSLETLVRACLVGGCDLASLLAGDPAVLSLPPFALPADLPRERHESPDWASVARALAAAARRGATLRSVADRCGQDPATLRQRFPELCRAVHASRARRRVVDAAAREQRLVALVRAIVADLRAAGIYPSRRQVEARLPEGVNLREKPLGDAWREARA